MNIAIAVILYLGVGYIGGRIAGYGGLLEICIWPLVLPLAIWLKWLNKKDGD